MNKKEIKFLIAQDVDDSLVSGHIFADTEITYQFMKHPRKTGDLLSRATDLDGHLLAVTTTCQFEDKIRTVLRFLFLSRSEEIPIISRQTDNIEEKNRHVLEAMKELNILFGVHGKAPLYIPLIIDDSTLAVEAALKRGWAGIVVASEHTMEMSGDYDQSSHLTTLEAILDDPENYAEICAAHNARFGVYPPEISQTNEPRF